ncbi:hypothetical protein Bbelb_297220 [Branchiostoma belcheri]|nr:hypothetical protein Bbelb_297220 [Branchiostoma belcheri]
MITQDSLGVKKSEGPERNGHTTHLRMPPSRVGRTQRKLSTTTLSSRSPFQPFSEELCVPRRIFAGLRANFRTQTLKVPRFGGENLRGARLWHLPCPASRSLGEANLYVMMMKDPEPVSMSEQYLTCVLKCARVSAPRFTASRSLVEANPDLMLMKDLGSRSPNSKPVSMSDRHFTCVLKCP